jgi:hypothetical protein
MGDKYFGTRAPLAAAITCGLLILGTSPAGAADPDPDPLAPLTGTVGKVLKPVQDAVGGTPATRSNGALPVHENDDPDREATDPSGPDHGSGESVDADAGDQDVADVAGSDATLADDDDSSADATVLALGGNEILGAHADSTGTRRQSAGDPLEPLCSGSDNALCVQLLYADAEAADGHSEARSGVAAVCLGGTDGDATDCDGQIGAGAVQSNGEVDRSAAGRTTASSGSSAANACVQQDPMIGTCTVDADVLRSEGRSGSSGSASKDSQVLGAGLDGTSVADTSEPTAIALPPACTSPSLACLFLNQGETYVGNGVAGHSVTALTATALDGSVIATLAHSETLVHQADRPTTSDPGGPVTNGGPATPDAGTPQAGGVPSDSVLPNTGGVLSALLMLGLFGVGLGSLLVAWSRRVALADGPA